MSTDWDHPCFNFRDVGLWVNCIAERRLLAEGVLFRGGSIDEVERRSQIGGVESVLNLRAGPDPRTLDVRYGHAPMPNGTDCYEPGRREVWQWFVRAFRFVAQVDRAWPLLVHCRWGKDRTGVVVGGLLTLAGVPLEVVLEEYALSDGRLDGAAMRGAMQVIHERTRHLPDGEVARVRARLAC